MHDDFETRYREESHRRMRRILSFLPLIVVGGAILVYAVGHLFMWLWRVTVVDLFGFKPVSFWQAWGLIVLAQILFKANLQPTTRTGRWRRHGLGGDTGTGSEPSPGPVV